MLLSAIYNNGVLLYSGACVPALGKCGNFQQDDTWSIQPAAYSETFMARFAQYQCIGAMSAGEAFLKAKCDYYNSSRGIEEDEMILGTVLMFNLYANLRLIHETISKNLYEKLGLEPRQLYSVEKFETTNAKGQRERGYLYNYGVENGPIKSKIRVRLDELGNINSALQTK